MKEILLHRKGKNDDRNKSYNSIPFRGCVPSFCFWKHFVIWILLSASPILCKKKKKLYLWLRSYIFFCNTVKPTSRHNELLSNAEVVDFSKRNALFRPFPVHSPPPPLFCRLSIFLLLWCDRNSNHCRNQQKHGRDEQKLSRNDSAPPFSACLLSLLMSDEYFNSHAENENQRLIIAKKNGQRTLCWMMIRSIPLPKVFVIVAMSTSLTDHYCHLDIFGEVYLFLLPHNRRN